MPRYTAAYSALVRRLDEIEALLSLARDASRRPTAPNLVRVAALCRGAVVLLSSHIEGYIEELGELALDRIVSRRVVKTSLDERFLFYCSRDLLGALRDSANPDKIAQQMQKILTRDSHVWDSSPHFTAPLDADRFSSGFSNPTTAKVVKYWRRFGYESYKSDVARVLAADYTPCWNMIDQVVEQRNRIAHGEQMSVGSPTDVADMLKLVRLFCRTTDEVVGRWFTSIRCSIR